MLNQVEEYTHLVSGQWTVDKKVNSLVYDSFTQL